MSQPADTGVEVYGLDYATELLLVRAQEAGIPVDDNEELAAALARTTAALYGGGYLLAQAHDCANRDYLLEAFRDGKNVEISAEAFGTVVFLPPSKTVQTLQKAGQDSGLPVGFILPQIRLMVNSMTARGIVLAAALNEAEKKWFSGRLARSWHNPVFNLRKAEGSGA